jgi:sporulation protein YlmC with PRC-barrel domain
MANPTIQDGAEVYTSDGHKLGKVIEVLSGEFLVEEGALVKHTRSFQYDAVDKSAPDRVDLTMDADAVKAKWNEVTLRDKHGRDRHVVQVGVPHQVPTYDEIQTTTGGPPTGESEVE